MEISGIVEAASMANRSGPANPSPGQAERVFETLLLETLLRESGIADGLADGAGREWAVLGDHFIQMLASQLAKESNLGAGRMLAATQG